MIELICGVISRKSSAFSFSGAVTFTTFPETTAILIIVIHRQGSMMVRTVSGGLFPQRAVSRLGFMHAGLVPLGCPGGC
jgi:hypothetical protein